MHRFKELFIVISIGIYLVIGFLYPLSTYIQIIQLGNIFNIITATIFIIIYYYWYVKNIIFNLKDREKKKECEKNVKN